MKSPSFAALLLTTSLICGRPTHAAPRPLIVISDIDDTIKVTGVVREIASASHAAIYPKDCAHLLGDPFRAWQPVEGMAARYRSWTGRAPVEFIYLSKGPWCYRSRLSRFLETNRFPSGPLMLNPHFPFASRSYKSAAIQKIIRAHPGSAFVLIGDSGENDPEIYGRIAAQFPDRVRRVFIRDVTPHNPPSRLATAFAGLPRTRWQLFARAAQLPATPLDRPAPRTPFPSRAKPLHPR